MEQQQDSEIIKTVGPDYLAPEWHDYVMSHFHEKELEAGYPNVDGLRRVSQLLLGEIIESEPVNVIVSTDLPPRATVTYKVRFRWNRDFDLCGSVKRYSYRTFGDVGDVWLGNTDATFAAFASSTACTRAEGRCLRKALRLRVCAAEELPKLDPAKQVAAASQTNPNVPNQITQEQELFLNKKCKDLDIEVFAFINSGENQYRSISSVTKETAAKMIKKLGEMKKDKTLISEEIKGYKENWRAL